MMLVTDGFKIGGLLSTRLLVKNNGNVGIGTTSPSSKLHIDSTSDAVHFTRSGQETYRIIHGTSGLYFTRPDSSALAFGVTQNSDFDIFNTSGGVMFRADASTGNVGIGTTSPSANLDILNGTTGASLKLSATTTAYWQLQRDPTTGNLNISDDGIGNVMSLDQVSGNVGIGTTSPVQKLHIVSTDGANIILNSNTGAEIVVFG